MEGARTVRRGHRFHTSLRQVKMQPNSPTMEGTEMKLEPSSPTEWFSYSRSSSTGSLHTLSSSTHNSGEGGRAAHLSRSSSSGHGNSFTH
uniref:Uncharacterized protein n=1 Tax=Timema shepardi TaxID=629360 RepID=A0A7R9G5S0_TIMSH|nr:unnamed protein product [Timema shepardi]